ncbi:SDR family NAD(P)-dependent oxidoreductase [Haliea sp. E17]|uniref:SDR family NAD(P)-dependent oxidoreductase n=1 Tax=Haliea sp. E17 TaxID=3401576 RepID=UPI003AAEEE67
MGVLEGKTALVTGGSRGLGRAVAVDYAKQGALVAINYARNDAAARETLDMIEAEGGKAFLVKCPQVDLASAEELKAGLDAGLMERTGSTGLDILVNNAGGGPMAAIDDTTTEIFEQIVSDNMRGPFYLTKVLKPQLRDNGRVIFFSSLGARHSRPNFVVYAMCKSAIETLTFVMAKELGHRGITVNCIMPGLIASDANAELRADPVARKHFEENVLLGRLGEPSDLSGVATSLASPQMGYVTGQVIEVSGGLFF